MNRVHTEFFSLTKSLEELTHNLCEGLHCSHDDRVRDDDQKQQRDGEEAHIHHNAEEDGVGCWFARIDERDIDGERQRVVGMLEVVDATEAVLLAFGDWEEGQKIENCGNEMVTEKSQFLIDQV